MTCSPPRFDRDLARQFLDAWRTQNGTAEIDAATSSPTTVSAEGREVEMRWQINARYGRFLYTLVQLFRPRRILEIGMANGISSAYLAKAQRGYLNGPGAHVAIDPFETTDWAGAGVALLQRLGLDGNVRLIEDYSIRAVPALEAAGERFDFVFIDGNHCLDYTLADVLVCDRVLDLGGLMVLDDSTDYGVRLAVPYLDRYRVNLTRVRLDSPPVHWLREHLFKRRRLTIYQKNAEDTRGVEGT